MEWNDAVHVARLEKKLSRSQLARAVGCRRMQIYRWEQALVQPRPKTWAALCEVLDLDPDLLVRIPRKRRARA
jgi:transcriptional regulator with XRE-family HTH domain